MERIGRDARIGFRALWRQPGFAIAAVATLGLGIGANAALFSVMSAVLLRPLPFDHGARALWITAVGPGRTDGAFSLPDFLDYREPPGPLDALSAVATWNANLTGDGEAERLVGLRVSANLFDTLGVGAERGRTLEPDDDRPGAPRVAVISHGLWQRRFGGDAGVIGRTLDLNGTSYTLVGVLPRNFPLPVRDADVAVPLVPDADPWRLDRKSVNFLRFVGRLRPGVGVERAETEMNALAGRLREEYRESNARKMGAHLTPLQEQIAGTYRTPLLVLMGAVGFVLLIACANIANLNLARATARQREVAIRSALGATRGDLVRQLFVESLLLALGGAFLGLVLAGLGVRSLVAMSPTALPRATEIRTDPAVLAFVAALAVLSAVLTGLVPALSVSRPEAAESLKEGGRGMTDGRGRYALRSILVSAEVALCVVLLTGAGLLLKSLARLESVDPGFDPGHLLAVRLSLPEKHYPHRADVLRFYDALVPRIEGLPGVSAQGVVNALPTSGTLATVDFTVVGRAFAREQIPEANFRVVSPRYLEAMRIPLRGGRAFSEADTETTRLVCLVNERLARRYWPQGGAIGSSVQFDDNSEAPRPAEIVGIVANVTQESLESPPSLDIYLPLRQVHEDVVVWLRNNQYWLLRTPGDPLALAGAFRTQVRAVDADVATSNVRSMEQYLAVSVAPRRFSLLLLGIFAGTALVLALVGVAAVLSYSVSRREHEIGVRLSLGAQPGDIRTLVLLQGMRPVLVGLALGFLGALALGRAIAGLLFGVAALEAGTYGSVGLLLVVGSLAAIYMPARRATRVDPLRVLRTE